jgi:hypothetical protein
MPPKGRYDYLDVNDAKIEAIWQSYLKSRGLRDDSDPIPRGETSEIFRRKWEKYLYSQSPTGAAASSSEEGGSITTVTPTIEAGALPDEIAEEDALKAGGVLFYEHEKYGGKVWVVPPGSYRWVEDVGIPNDTITSIKVPKGYKCKIFEHADFNGMAREITGSIANLGDDWNDKMSSLKVYKSAS